MAGVRPSFKGFEVRVVIEARQTEMEEIDYRSSGALKFVGGILICLVGLEDVTNILTFNHELQRPE